MVKHKQLVVGSVAVLVVVGCLLLLYFKFHHKNNVKMGSQKSSKLDVTRVGLGAADQASAISRSNLSGVKRKYADINVGFHYTYEGNYAEAIKIGTKYENDSEVKDRALCLLSVTYDLSKQSSLAKYKDMCKKSSDNGGSNEN